MKTNIFFITWLLIVNAFSIELNVIEFEDVEKIRINEGVRDIECFEKKIITTNIFDGNISIYNGEIHVLDKSSSSIKKFDFSGKFLESIKLDGIFQPTSFIELNDKIVLTAFDFKEENILYLYDRKGQLLNKTFLKKKINNRIENLVQNSYIVEEYRNQVGVFPLKQNEFYVYDEDSNEMHSTILDLPFEIKHLEYESNFWKIKNEIYLGSTVFNDIHFMNDTLYALVGGGTFENEVLEQSQKMYILKINEDKSMFYELSPEIFSDMEFTSLMISGDANNLFISGVYWDFILKIPLYLLN